MDLDEMKEQVKKVKAPGSGQGAPGNRPADDLIAVLKAEDAKDNKRIRRTMVFFAIAGMFYSGIFTLTWIAPPDDSPNLHRILLGMFALAFLSIGIYSRMKSREFSGIDYTEPLRIFLAKSEGRYQFFHVTELMFTVSYLLILGVTCTVALMTGLERYIPSLDPSAVLLFCCILFPISWVVGFALARREWKRRKEPLLEEIRAMQVALAEGEAT